MTARGPATPNRAQAPVLRRSSGSIFPPTWNVAAGASLKCGDLLQTMADISTVIITASAILASASILVFVRT
jgi:hypothetical protein